MRLASLALAAISSIGVYATAAVASVDVGGARFAARVESTEPMVLKGSGVLRWKSLIRAYAAALYLPSDVSTGGALDDVPKRLEIEYFWAIDGPARSPQAIPNAASTVLRMIPTSAR